MESNDIFVLELLHEGNLADGSRRSAFFRVEVDFLEGNKFTGLSVTTFENLKIQAQAGVKKGNQVDGQRLAALRRGIQKTYGCVGALT